MIASQLPGLIHLMVYVWWAFSLSYFCFPPPFLFLHIHSSFDSVPALLALGIHEMNKTQLCPGEALSLAGQTDRHRSHVGPGAVRCVRQGHPQWGLMKVRAKRALGEPYPSSLSFGPVSCLWLSAFANKYSHLGTIQHCY